MTQKNKIVLFSVLTVFALFAVIAVPSVSATYPANAVYFEPEDSSAKFCENTYVQIMVNANAASAIVGMNVYFDSDCINITNVDFTGTPYSFVTGWTHWGNYVTIGVMSWDPIDPGIHLVANLTLHCEKETYCTSDLVFTEPLELADEDGNPLLDVTWHDGTFTCEIPPGKPDLNVTEITVNYDASSLGGRAVGPEPGPGVHTQCNNISAVIEEDNGIDVVSPFDVTFKVDGTTLRTVQVPGLAGGATKTVYCNCSWYPMAGDNFAIKVTVDSNNEISESDETNNTMWNKGTVVSNGYKGDGWQGPDKNLTNVQCHDQDKINLTHSVGDSYYAKGNWSGTTNYVANWTTSDLPVPEGADIEKAWLYVYYTWDKEAVMPDGVSLTFNGPNVLLARQYSDRKGFGKYNYPYGMLVYDVTNEFDATGNTAVLTKATPDTYIPIKGMLLMVVYNHPDEPERIICIDEGYDMINAQASYAVTPEEATTYASFECCEPIPRSDIGKATLVAVAPGASKGDDKNRLSFNDGLWKGAWSGFAGSTELGIAETDVIDYLKEENNVANFQDRGDWMEASNAFLILEKKIGEKKPDLVITNVWTVDGHIHYTIKNKGCIPTERSYTGVYSNGRYVARGIAGPLAAGEARDEKINYKGGDTVCADYQNRIDESNEDNNCNPPGPGPTPPPPTPTPPTPTPGPDLVITNVWTVDGKIHYTIANQGDATAPRSFTGVYANGRYVARGIAGPLAPGQARDEEIKYKGGNTVCADYQNRISESNEDNNCCNWH